MTTVPAPTRTTLATPSTLTLRLATSTGDRMRAEYLISDVYNQHYDIVFSRDLVDLDARIEPYPDDYLLAYRSGQLVAVAGLYVHHTYVQQFGGVTREDIERELEKAGQLGAYDPDVAVEITKLTVRPEYTGERIGMHIFQAAHSASFLTREDRRPVLLVCANQRVFDHLHTPAGITTRFLREFPDYAVHDQYRSPDNPMSSRLIIPELDIPREWWENPLPRTVGLGTRTEGDPAATEDA
ncbi:MAG: hypothetical protein H6734_11495 [Alphaproteobacteria bacterium]|nr:hypothetical protein [Alphaproteobacteria bacterium]